MLDSATHAHTSGHDSHRQTAVSLARVGPPDSEVNNAPFSNTSYQLEVHVAARTGTLPQRVKNPNRLTAR